MNKQNTLFFFFGMVISAAILVFLLFVNKSRVETLKSNEIGKAIQQPENFYASPPGSIAILVGDQRIEDTRLLLLTPNGSTIEYIGGFQGSLAFSPDGKFLAAGCKGDLCIINIQPILDDENEFITLARGGLPKKIQMPSECWSDAKYGFSGHSGLLSVSWSPDAKHLVLVCGDALYTNLQSVCVVSVDDEFTCWEEEEARNVFRAVWSPIDNDSILISGTENLGIASTIQITDTEGKNRKFVVNGWSGEWSPDGKQIAYISEKDYGRLINIVNADGSNSQEIKLPFYIYFECNWYVTNCRLSWSPDGRYIVFASSSFPGQATIRLYRYDLQTGEIIGLIDPILFQNSSEPDWGSPISK